VSILTLERLVNGDAAAERSRAVVGTLHSISAEGIPFVDYPGNEGGPTQARVAVTGSPAFTVGSPVLLLFEDAGSTRPIIVAPIADRLPKPPRGRRESADRDAIVDGKRVVFEAQQEIVLRCGQGSITLSANGKIVVKGTELVSRASGANKIRGALVNIN
jgi:hypothetical protein